MYTKEFFKLAAIYEKGLCIDLDCTLAAFSIVKSF